MDIMKVVSYQILLIYNKQNFLIVHALWAHTGCTVMCINEMWDITGVYFVLYIPSLYGINQNGQIWHHEQTKQ